MKSILNLIQKKQAEFSQLPLYQFLRNESIAPQERLAFVPCFSFFVMGFGELNTSAFREEPTHDPIQKIVNQHTYEDDCHWPWFLEDLERLGMNYPLEFTTCLKYLWGKDNQFSRQTIYKLYQLGYKAHPIQKLAIIEAIEATADVFLAATSKVCEDFKFFAKNETYYHYLGKHHFAVDTSHTIYSSELQKLIENIQIPEDIKDSVYAAVEQVFEIFTEFNASLLEYAQNYSVNDPLKDMSLSDELKFIKRKTDSPDHPPVVVSLTVAKNDVVSSDFKPLGAYLVESGLLTSDQLTVALNDQQQNSLRLGEIISQRGWVNQETIEYMMEKLVLPERKIRTINRNS